MSKETKHTPGPWEWRQNEHGQDYELVSASTGQRIHTDGSACDEYSPDIDVHGPDAKLIAAAPDMLEVLKAVAVANPRGQIVIGTRLVSITKLVADAICKATTTP